jgi:hypothetical protein
LANIYLLFVGLRLRSGIEPLAVLGRYLAGVLGLLLVVGTLENRPVCPCALYDDRKALCEGLILEAEEGTLSYFEGLAGDGGEEMGR